MKRLIICCDGTWNSLQTAHQGTHSNVVEMARAILPMDYSASSTGDKAAIPQIVFYDDGVGTGYSKVDRFLGGAIGVGIDANILEAYRFLCMNYHAGDEIYLFGFSRGSYTVRSVVGLINRVGLLRRECLEQIGVAYQLYRKVVPNIKAKAYYQFQQELIDFRKANTLDRSIPIKLLCCWDTVGSLGIPDIPFLRPVRWFSENILNHRYSFHDMNLSPLIENAIHAIALNEDRRVFDLTPMLIDENREPKPNLEQCWFIGNHSCCGGGVRELSSINFIWVVETIKQLGLQLQLDSAVIDANRQAQNYLYAYNTPATKRANRLWWVLNWPIFRPHQRQQTPETAQYFTVHPTVKQRLQVDPIYANSSIPINISGQTAIAHT